MKRCPHKNKPFRDRPVGCMGEKCEGGPEGCGCVYWGEEGSGCGQRRRHGKQVRKKTAEEGA